jgi:hypothetical protein
MSDIFLSYKKENEKKAQTITNRLRKACGILNQAGFFHDE